MVAEEVVRFYEHSGHRVLPWQAKRVTDPLRRTGGKAQGGDVLMRAIPLILARHPDCRFAFNGRVSDEGKDQVSTMQTSVQFLGVRLREELVSWYQRASVFVAPSRWNKSPNTVYEAMACGTPVIATRVRGDPRVA